MKIVKIYHLIFIAIFLPAAVFAIERINVDSSGAEADSRGFDSSINYNGRYVVFSSDATNLVPGDTNGEWDIFIRDRIGGTTERISIDSSETQVNDHSTDPDISADGRYIVFESDASNLVVNDTNDAQDVFIRDRINGTTERISIDSVEAQANSHSFESSISADGLYVVFTSYASNLVTGDTNDYWDIFIRDRVNDTTELISVDSTEVPANARSYEPKISADGRYIVFLSDATNLVNGDTNNQLDIFLRDRVNGTTERISINSSGAQADDKSINPSISADGRYVVFTSYANNLISTVNYSQAVLIRDRNNNTTELINVSSSSPSISDNGRFIAFSSSATDLVVNDTNNHNDIFIRDRVNGTTERININSSEVQANDDSFDSEISADGRYTVFKSDATNLVSDDTNAVTDIFARARKINTSAFSRIPDFDSGWIAITPGEDKVIVHNLGQDVSEYVIYVNGQDSSGKIERYCYGGCDQGVLRQGFYWHELQENSINVKLREEDTVTKKIHLQIWNDPYPDFDSGWQWVFPGDTGPLFHNLGGNADDYIIDLQFSEWLGLPPHQMYYGGIHFGQGPDTGKQWHG